MSDRRKQDHIELAFKSVAGVNTQLKYTTYEPLLVSHPTCDESTKAFLGFDFGLPLWISSMTGGTEKAAHINKNLAQACAEFKIGMGLGSCRPLLESDERFDDFNLRGLVGDKTPFYTNYGIAQLEELIDQKKLSKLSEIQDRLQATGMFIHVNPLQEWAQPEGDRFKRSPLETIKYICSEFNFPIIVKEVGQGMGPKSLAELTKLPIAAIELAAYGGTNFTVLEQTRRTDDKSGKTGPSSYVGAIGHNCYEMIDWLNELPGEKPNIIISGGIKDPIIGHDLMVGYQGESVVGMASEVLKHALGDYEELRVFLLELKECFALAQAYLKARD